MKYFDIQYWWSSHFSSYYFISTADVAFCGMHSIGWFLTKTIA